MNYLRAAHNWGHASVRAVFYGTMGTAVGWLPGMRRFTHWCMHQWCSGSANALKINRTLVDGERLAETGQAIMIANHLSTLDVLVLGSFLDRDFRWLAKSSLFNVPFSGWYLRNAGHIPVHRGKDAQDRNRQIGEHVHRVVKEGASVLFFPEGTRSTDGQLKDFRMGAFLSAVREDLPVLPLVIRGTHELMAAGAKDLAIRADRSCSISVLDPIHPSSIGLDGELHERAGRLRDAAYAIYYRELHGASQDGPNDER